MVTAGIDIVLALIAFGRFLIGWVDMTNTAMCYFMDDSSIEAPAPFLDKCIKTYVDRRAWCGKTCIAAHTPVASPLANYNDIVAASPQAV